MFIMNWGAGCWANSVPLPFIEFWSQKSYLSCKRKVTFKSNDWTSGSLNLQWYGTTWHLRHSRIERHRIPRVSRVRGLKDASLVKDKDRRHIWVKGPQLDCECLSWLTEADIQEQWSFVCKLNKAFRDIPLGFSDWEEIVRLEPAHG